MDQVSRTKAINIVQSRAYSISYSNTTLCATRVLHLGYLEFYSDYGRCKSDYSGCGEQSRQRRWGMRPGATHMAIFVDVESVYRDSINCGMATVHKTNTPLPASTACERLCSASLPHRGLTLVTPTLKISYR